MSIGFFYMRIFLVKRQLSCRLRWKIALVLAGYPYILYEFFSCQLYRFSRIPRLVDIVSLSGKSHKLIRATVTTTKKKRDFVNMTAMSRSVKRIALIRGDGTVVRLSGGDDVVFSCTIVIASRFTLFCLFVINSGAECRVSGRFAED